MPLYTYRAINPEQSCRHCIESLEVFQKFSDSRLPTCPECGCEIVRFMHPTPVHQDHSDKTILGDDNLRKHGFKKLVNRGGGKFDEVV